MPRAKKSNVELLEKEITLLGGTKDDLQLIAGIDEGEAEFEVYNDSTTDGDNLPLDELRSFMKQIGIQPDNSLASEFFSAEVNDAASGGDESSADISDDEDNRKAATREEDAPVKSAAVLHQLPPGKMQIQPTNCWHQLTVDLTLAEATNAHLTDKQLEEIYQLAKQLADRESRSYESYRSQHSSSDAHWFRTLMKSGTLTDRVSALTLAIQESPLHTLALLDQLMGMAKKNNRREAVASIDALKDLMLGTGGDDDNGLVPAGRKLLFFREQPRLAAIANILLASPVKQQPQTNSSSTIKRNKHKQQQQQRPQQPQQQQVDAKRKAAAEQLLVLWFAEDLIKTRYYELILLLDQYSRDTVYHNKSKMLVHAFDLLAAKREQEHTLLTFMVNKLGDKDRKLASKVTFLLHRLIEKHPLMKLIIVKEVEMFFWRQGVSDRARYYALVFLNQLVLSAASDGDILTARYLVSFYFSVFTNLLAVEGKAATSNGEDNGAKEVADKPKKPAPSKKSKKQQQQLKSKKQSGGDDSATAVDKIMAAVLTGMSRASPFAWRQSEQLDSSAAATINANTLKNKNNKLISRQQLEELFEQNADSLFRLAHSQSLPFTVSVQAMQIVYHSLFHSDPAAKNSNTNNNSNYNNYNSSGTGESALEAVMAESAVFAPKRVSRYQRSLYGMLSDQRLSQSPKSHALLLNLLFKSLRVECQMLRSGMSSSVRLLALTRRLMQVCLCGGVGPAFCAGSLVVIGEIVKRLSAASDNSDSSNNGGGDLLLARDVDNVLRTGVEKLKLRFITAAAAAAGGEAEDDEEEHFYDVPDEDENQQPTISSPNNDSNINNNNINSNSATDLKQQKQPGDQQFDNYDPLHRSPEFSRADQTSCWELFVLSQHYHPSVQLFAQTLLNGNPVNYPSDPLQDFTLSHFLDRFVYRNPKSLTVAGAADSNEPAAVKKQAAIKGHRGASRMQPQPFQSTVLRCKMPMDRQFDVPITVLAKQRGGDLNSGKRGVPVDESFYAEYFAHKSANDGSGGAKPLAENDSDVGELSDNEIDAAIMNSIPAGDDDDDDEDLIDSEKDDDDGSDNAELEGYDDSDAVDEDMGIPDVSSDAVDEEDDDDEANGEFNDSDSDDDLLLNALQDDGDDEEVEDGDGDESLNGVSDSDGDGDDESDVEDKQNNRASKRRQQKAAIRQKLSVKQSLAGGVSGSDRLRSAVKAAAARTASSSDSVEPKRRVPGSIFASSDHYSHLLEQEPSFNDPYWAQERVATAESVSGAKRRRGNNAVSEKTTGVSINRKRQRKK